MERKSITMGNLNIAIGFDNQADISLVLIKSVIEHSPVRLIKLHVFLNDKINFNFHEKWLKQNSINYELYLIKESDLGSLKINKSTYNRITDAAFYRLLMPFKINTSVDWFLYLDTDTYIIHDISTLMNRTYSSKSLYAVPNDSGVFNSGVLIINRINFIKLLPLDKIIELFEIHNFASDNELLVYVFENTFGKLNESFNFPVQYYLTQKKHGGPKKLDINNAIILHFLGTSKPWRYSTNMPMVKQWRDTYIDIHNRPPWKHPLEFKEYILKIAYLIFPNPQFLWDLGRYIRKFNRNTKKLFTSLTKKTRS
jgi:lipopolysaccharide biosynthesis glycosyltransferase